MLVECRLEYPCICVCVCMCMHMCMYMYAGGVLAGVPAGVRVVSTATGASPLHEGAAVWAAAVGRFAESSHLQSHLLSHSASDAASEAESSTSNVEVPARRTACRA